MLLSVASLATIDPAEALKLIGSPDTSGASKSAQFTEAEERVHKLRAHFNDLSFKSEERQAELERLAIALNSLSLVPENPEAALKSPRRPNTATAASLDGAESVASSTMSQRLGSTHPTVILEKARLSAEMQLLKLEPQLADEEAYSETLEMMLHRLRDAHARRLADIATRRDQGIALAADEADLKQLLQQGRGAGVPGAV